MIVLMPVICWKIPSPMPTTRTVRASGLEKAAAIDSFGRLRSSSTASTISCSSSSVSGASGSRSSWRTSRAPSTSPLITSQRGLLGSTSMPRNSSVAGTAASAKTIRHSSAVAALTM